MWIYVEHHLCFPLNQTWSKPMIYFTEFKQKSSCFFHWCCIPLRASIGRISFSFEKFKAYWRTKPPASFFIHFLEFNTVLSASPWYLHVSSRLPSSNNLPYPITIKHQAFCFFSALISNGNFLEHESFLISLGILSLIMFVSGAIELHCYLHSMQTWHKDSNQQQTRFFCCWHNGKEYIHVAAAENLILKI